MRVLIVEDDENKRMQLSEFLGGALTGVDLHIARSLHGGIRKVRQERPDLIILDMTLPNYDPGPDESGGQTHPLGGREFLGQLERFDIRVPVIVVTQFETFGKGPQAMNIRDLDRDLRGEFPEIYKGTVYYHAAIQGWKQELDNILRGLEFKEWKANS